MAACARFDMKTRQLNQARYEGECAQLRRDAYLLVKGSPEEAERMVANLLVETTWSSDGEMREAKRLADAILHAMGDRMGT